MFGKSERVLSLLTPLAPYSLGVRLSLRIPQVASSNLDAGEIHSGHVSLVAAGGMFGKEIWVFTFHVNYPFVYHREMSILAEGHRMPVKIRVVYLPVVDKTQNT